MVNQQQILEEQQRMLQRLKDQESMDRYRQNQKNYLGDAMKYRSTLGNAGKWMSSSANDTISGLGKNLYKHTGQEALDGLGNKVSNLGKNLFSGGTSPLNNATYSALSGSLPSAASTIGGGLSTAAAPTLAEGVGANTIANLGANGLANGMGSIGSSIAAEAGGLGSGATGLGTIGSTAAATAGAGTEAGLSAGLTGGALSGGTAAGATGAAGAGAMGALGAVAAPLALGYMAFSALNSAKQKKNQEAMQADAKAMQHDQELSDQSVANSMQQINQNNTMKRQELNDSVIHGLQTNNTDDLAHRMMMELYGKPAAEQYMQPQHADEGVSGTLPQLPINPSGDVQTPQNEAPISSVQPMIDNMINQLHESQKPTDRIQDLFNKYKGSTVGLASTVDNTVQNNGALSPQFVKLGQDGSAVPAMASEIMSTTNPAGTNPPANTANTEGAMDATADKKSPKAMIADMLMRVGNGFRDNRSNGFNPTNWTDNSYTYTTQDVNPNLAKAENLKTALSNAGITDNETYQNALQGLNGGNKTVDQAIKAAGITPSADGSPIDYTSKTLPVEHKAEKNWANRLGEAIGTTNRLLSNPAAQGLIAGAIYQARNHDGGKAVEYGVNWANNKAKSDAYGRMINGKDWTPGMFTGNYDKDDYNAYTRASHYEDMYRNYLMQAQLKDRKNDIDQQRANQQGTHWSNQDRIKDYDSKVNANYKTGMLGVAKSRAGSYAQSVKNQGAHLVRSDAIKDKDVNAKIENNKEVTNIRSQAEQRAQWNQSIKNGTARIVYDPATRTTYKMDKFDIDNLSPEAKERIIIKNPYQSTAKTAN